MAKVTNLDGKIGHSRDEEDMIFPGALLEKFCWTLLYVTDGANARLCVTEKLVIQREMVEN